MINNKWNVFVRMVMQETKYYQSVSHRTGGRHFVGWKTLVWTWMNRSPHKMAAYIGAWTSADKMWRGCRSNQLDSSFHFFSVQVSNCKLQSDWLLWATASSSVLIKEALMAIVLPLTWPCCQHQPINVQLSFPSCYGQRFYSLYLKRPINHCLGVKVAMLAASTNQSSAFIC